MDKKSAPPSYEASIHQQNQPLPGYSGTVLNQENPTTTSTNAGHVATTLTRAANTTRNVTQTNQVVGRRFRLFGSTQNGTFWTRNSNRWQNTPNWLRAIIFWFCFGAIIAIIVNVIKTTLENNQKEESP